MTFPVLTAFYGAILGIVFVALSLAVSIGRFHYRANHGDRGKVPLQRLIRAQANYAEYVPFAVLLIGLNEAGGASPGYVRALLVVLLIGRLMHIPGMFALEGSAQQFSLRAPGILITWAVMLVASVSLLLR